VQLLGHVTQREHREQIAQPVLGQRAPTTTRNSRGCFFTASITGERAALFLAAISLNTGVSLTFERM